MINDRSFQADFVYFFGELVNFLVGCVAKKERDASIGADTNDLSDLRLELALLIQVVMAHGQGLFPGNRAYPTLRIAAFDKTTVSSHRRQCDYVGENRQPNRDAPRIDGFAHCGRSYRRQG